jgi:glucose-1-phosphate adenylyltransferase
MNNCNVHQSIITEGCILNGADIKHSIIGVRSRIGGGTTVKNSIIMGADYFETARELEENAARRIPHMGIGNHCTIINAIIDKNVRIGDSVSIINAHNLQEKDEENHRIRDGIVVPKGSLIRNRHGYLSGRLRIAWIEKCKQATLVAKTPVNGSAAVIVH